MSEFNGSAHSTLLYWIQERERVRQRKETDQPKPWSKDWVFQDTYFCNVHREDDRVTRYIRNRYPNAPHIEFNLIIARLVNNERTLMHMPYYGAFYPETMISEWLDITERLGKFWGDAYIVSTNGRAMPKITYVVEHILADAWGEKVTRVHRMETCKEAHWALMLINGMGSFMAAQVVADLKNTIGHPLNKAVDKLIFVAPGPGSLKGLSWLYHGEPGKVTPRQFAANFEVAWLTVCAEIYNRTGDRIDAQDFQNCLCEFDKYMRVSTGAGRSKRRYDAR